MSLEIKRSTCSKNGINPKAVYDFIERGERENLGINSFILIKNQKVVAEGVYPPYDKETTHSMYSVSKSITATAIGFAIDEGKVNLEDSVSKFFPEYDKLGYNKNITVRHLITMTAGKMIGMARSRHLKDWLSIFFNAPFYHKPGKKFMYVNDNFYILSAIISVVYGETLVDFLYPRLFEPLGIKKPMWEQGIHGHAAGGWGLYLSTDDFAKIMLCYANGGVYCGKQVIPADWIEQATSYQVPTVKRGQPDVTQGYGYGFWRTSIPNTYRAYGLFGQMGYVFEDKDTVLVINAAVSQDELLSKAVHDMAKELWNEPVKEYEDKLKKKLAELPDKDYLPAIERNTELEQKYNNKALYTRSSPYASMLNVTISTVFNEYVGRTDRFIFHLDKDNELYLVWKEGSFVNKLHLGFNNKYENTVIKYGDIKFTACTKAAWIRPKVLRILVRIEEACQVRQLDFDFTNERHIIVKNSSFPDLPTLAVHYVDFSGFPLPDKLERMLKKYIAPAVLLIGEPDYKIK
ncbi:MAG: serine hydrolase [Ruminococcaceae bacterium]|nr:serine hydrolase [Oscillospiraceae bacterium]